MKNVNKYKKKLSEYGLNGTIQRAKILEYLDQNRTHPSAKSVYEGLKAEGSNLSKATVYNTLKLFSEARIIHELTVFENEIRYEYNTNFHIHFKCTECKNISDWSYNRTLDLDELLGDAKIKEYQLYIKGICENCLKKEE